MKENTVGEKPKVVTFRETGYNVTPEEATFAGIFKMLLQLKSLTSLSHRQESRLRRRTSRTSRSQTETPTQH